MILECSKPVLAKPYVIVIKSLLNNQIICGIKRTTKIPNEIRYLTALEELDASYNQLVSDISDISQNLADISANYVQKTGDTMTGKLTITTSGELKPGIEIYSTSEDVSLLLRSDWDDGSSHGEAYIEYRNTHIDLSNNYWLSNIFNGRKCNWRGSECQQH